MVSTKVEIINKLGLHVRSATQLVKIASTFDADISLVCNGQTADAKSIMEVLMLAATVNTEVELKAEGSSTEEEEEAINQLKTLIENRFNENE